MKKVKIMLLSLALFAVVGGALAFKAKYNKSFCTTDAYWNQDLANPLYYCAFDPGTGVTTTTCGGNKVFLSTIDPAIGAIKKVCTTTTLNQVNCNVVCNVFTTIKADQ
jgi:hypothetical protein